MLWNGVPKLAIALQMSQTRCRKLSPDSFLSDSKKKDQNNKITAIERSLTRGHARSHSAIKSFMRPRNTIHSSKQNRARNKFVPLTDQVIITLPNSPKESHKIIVIRELRYLFDEVRKPPRGIYGT